MLSIENIVNRLNDLRVYGKRDQEIKLYILDLINLYSYADSQKVKKAICNNASNYLEVLEINFFSRFSK